MLIRSFLAKQLGHPAGIFGRSIMRLLNRGNAEMNDVTFDRLNLQPTDSILEIGFGGGYLLNKIAASQIPSFVAGVDPQADVIQMGNKKFNSQIERGYIELKQGSGENLPYSDNTFNKICTVNTIYFWSDPQSVLNECRRVLQPNGKLVICYNCAAFLKQTKLTQHGFKTYEPEDLESLMQGSGYSNIDTIATNGGTGKGRFYCTSGFVEE